MTPKGGTLTLNLSRYIVVNLETRHADGLGRRVHRAPSTAARTATSPARTSSPTSRSLVFTVERARPRLRRRRERRVPAGLGRRDRRHRAAPITSRSSCSRSPRSARSSPSRAARCARRTRTWNEPDIIRVVGTADGTTVTTNLPAPYNSFTLNARAGQDVRGDARLRDCRRRAPVQVAQYLVLAALREARLHRRSEPAADPRRRAAPQGLRVPRPGHVPARTTRCSPSRSARPSSLDGIVARSASSSRTASNAPIGDRRRRRTYEQVTCLVADGPPRRSAATSRSASRSTATTPSARTRSSAAATSRSSTRSARRADAAGKPPGAEAAKVALSVVALARAPKTTLDALGGGCVRISDMRRRVHFVRINGVGPH